MCRSSHSTKMCPSRTYGSCFDRMKRRSEKEWMGKLRVMCDYVPCISYIILTQGRSRNSNFRYPFLTWEQSLIEDKLQCRVGKRNGPESQEIQVEETAKALGIKVLGLEDQCRSLSLTYGRVCHSFCREWHSQMGGLEKNQTLAPECHRQCTRIEPFLRLVVAVLSHLGEAFKSLLFSLYNEKVKFINF